MLTLHPCLNRATKNTSTSNWIFSVSFSNDICKLAKWGQIMPDDPHPCWFYSKVLMRDEAEFTYGEDMLTLINEKFKAEFIHTLGTFASTENGN